MMEENQHLLIIGYVWPEPQSSAAGRRMMDLIEIFQSNGWNITFASSAAHSEHAVDLETIGIETAEIQVNNSDFDDFVRELEPDAVLFDRFVTEEQFGWRVAEQCPDAVRLLDTEDLHFLRRVRKTAVKEGRPFDNEDLLREETTKREIASIYRCDLSLMISEFEMNLLTDFFNIDENLLCYIPFLLDSIGEQDTENWPSFSERNHFVTIGNFRHPPNWDAVLYLKQQIWPLIKKELPDAELHIYGSYVTKKAQQLHNPEDGFFIEGRAPEAKEVIRQARVSLAPLRFGAGLKGKLVEAMQCGTPSVTTDIGAEGLNGTLEWSGRIENNPEKIAAAAVELYINKSDWSSAQENGIRIINGRFTDSGFADELLERVNAIREQLDEHRLHNFMGQMLLHHSMASTEYMSRWIEVKNNG